MSFIEHYHRKINSTGVHTHHHLNSPDEMPHQTEIWPNRSNNLCMLNVKGIKWANMGIYIFLKEGALLFPFQSLLKDGMLGLGI